MLNRDLIYIVIHTKLVARLVIFRNRANGYGAVFIFLYIPQKKSTSLSQMKAYRQ